MGYFNKVPGSTVNGGGAYFCRGKHRVRIKMTKIVDGHSGVSAIIETEVVSTNAADVEPDRTKVIKPGESRSQVIPNYGRGQQMFGPNVKRFVLAVCGIEPESNDEAGACRFMEEFTGSSAGSMTFEEVCDRVFDEEANLFAGIEMDLECIHTVTKAEKKDFTKHMWRAADWSQLEA